MNRPYRVVISEEEKFFLNLSEIKKLAKAGQKWASSVISADTVDKNKFFPSQEDLPRHDRSLIKLASKSNRLKVVELQVKFWPPKYAVLGNPDSAGEYVIEPYTVPWKTVYYPEDYLGIERTEEERLRMKVLSIAP